MIRRRQARPTALRPTARRPSTITAPTRSRCSRASRRCASAPRMYIGSTAAAGLHHLVYEVVDNSIDEAMAGFCDTIDVTIHIDDSVHGRGQRPRHPRRISTRAADPRSRWSLTMLHAGGKFDNDSYKVSGGLHGVGVSVVNALSEGLEVEVCRDEQVYRSSRTSAASLPPTWKSPARRSKRGTKVTFKPDHEIFETTEFSFDTLAQPPARAGVPEPRRRRSRSTDERGRRSRTSSSTRAASASSSSTSTRTRPALTDKPIYMRGRARTASTSRSRCSTTTATTRRVYSLRQQHQHARGRHAPLRASARR